MEENCPLKGTTILSNEGPIEEEEDTVTVQKTNCQLLLFSNK